MIGASELPGESSRGKLDGLEHPFGQAWQVRLAGLRLDRLGLDRNRALARLARLELNRGYPGTYPPPSEPCACLSSPLSTDLGGRSEARLTRSPAHGDLVQMYFAFSLSEARWRASGSSPHVYM